MTSFICQIGVYICLAWFAIVLGRVHLDANKASLLLVFSVLIRTDQTLLDFMFSMEQKWKGALPAGDTAPVVLSVEACKLDGL